MIMINVMIEGVMYKNDRQSLISISGVYRNVIY